MSRYVVIGGSGFVGQWLVKTLVQRGADVLVDDIAPFPDNTQGFNYLNMDIRFQDQVKLIGFKPDDIVIHLAANQYHLKPPRKNRKEYFFETNYNGTENILREMYRIGCKNLIYFSTDMVYGKPLELPVKSDHPQNPFGFYGLSKQASEQLCREFREKKINITIFRPRMIIGPGRLGILKKLFKLIELNLPIPLIGDGRNCYQMVSVFDVVEAILQAVNKGIPNAEYNLGSINPPTVYNLLKETIIAANSKSLLVKTPGILVKNILSFLGKVGVELMYNEQYEIADQEYLLDISNTCAELDWQPKYSDTQMLIQAYKTWQNEMQSSL